MRVWEAKREKERGRSGHKDRQQREKRNTRGRIKEPDLGIKKLLTKKGRRLREEGREDRREAETD